LEESTEQKPAAKKVKNSETRSSPAPKTKAQPKKAAAKAAAAPPPPAPEEPEDEEMLDESSSEMSLSDEGAVPIGNNDEEDEFAEQQLEIALDDKTKEEITTKIASLPVRVLHKPQ